MRPSELRLPTGSAFWTFQAAAFAASVVIFIAAKSNDGLRLPLSSIFIRQLLENKIPVVVSTLLEPFWMVLSRLICLLQPWEELRGGGAPASTSISLNYNSLPPQFAIWKALRAGHWILAVICCMGILANGLTVSLSGLFYEDTVSVSSPINLTSSYAPRFVALNGSGLPFNAHAAGNWQGGTSLDQFYRAMSNMTADTPLPPWTDDRYAYVPVNLPTDNSTATYQVKTHAFGAQLTCQPLNVSGPSRYTLEVADDASSAAFRVVLGRTDGRSVHCTDLVQAVGSPNHVLQDLWYPQPGRVALEMGFGLGNSTDAADDAICRQHIVAGWVRADIGSRVTDTGYSNVTNMQLKSIHEAMMLCQPVLQAIEAEVVVDWSGRPRGLVSANVSSGPMQSFFDSSAADLIAQAHQFIIDNGATWHKDASPSDFNNYLMAKVPGMSQVLNATAPVPSFALVAVPYQRLYTRLFALLLGPNADLLFAKSTVPELAVGKAFVDETRIFLSLPAFLMSEMILGAYMLTTIMLYARRPGRFLPRLPPTMASMIAYFAASYGLREMGGKRNSGAKNQRWTYGEYMGTDGVLHTGVEREPLLRRRAGRDTAVCRG